MKKLLYTIILVLSTIVAFSQDYKPMNGYYQWNGNLRFGDTLFIDTGAVDINDGFYLTLDSTGSSVSGYYRIKLDTAAGGGGGSAEWGEIEGDIADQLDLGEALDEREYTLTSGDGISINRTDPLNPVISTSGTVTGSGDQGTMAYWTTNYSLSGANAVGYDDDSGSVYIYPSNSDGIGLQITGYPDTDFAGVGIQNATIKANDDTLILQANTTSNMRIGSVNAISAERTTSTVTIGEGAAGHMNMNIPAVTTGEEAFFFDATGKGYLGIGTKTPENQLHIKGATDDIDRLIKLENSLIRTGGSETATLTNSHVPGNPNGWLAIEIDDAVVLIPFWNNP